MRGQGVGDLAGSIHVEVRVVGHHPAEQRDVEGVVLLEGGLEVLLVGRDGIDSLVPDDLHHPLGDVPDLGGGEEQEVPGLSSACGGVLGLALLPLGFGDLDACGLEGGFCE